MNRIFDHDETWVIRGARVFSDRQAPAVADVVVTGERIAAVEPAGSVSLPAVLDATGLDLLPGAIDLHVHLRDPGQTHKETVETGTAAAACGGTTLVCDMPSTQPQVIDAARYAAKVASWRTRASVDFALWAGGTDPVALHEMAGLGAIGVKIYMATAPGFDELFSPDRPAVRGVLEVSQRLGWAVSVHAGDQRASDEHRERLIAAGRRDPYAVLEVNRGPGNLSGIATVLDLSGELGRRVHFAHLSAYGPEALDLFLAARRRHPELLTAETCFPGLTEEEDLPRQGVYVLPTVFAAPFRERLLAALAAGELDAIATDHAPHTREEKDRGGADAWAAPAGYPALETSLPLAYDAMLRGALPPRRMAAVTAGAPARILGLAHKGRIAPGAHADLVLADPAGSWTIDEAELHSKVGWSPYHGRTLRGRLRATYLRGRMIARDGQLLAAGTGRFTRPGADEHDEAAP